MQSQAEELLIREANQLKKWNSDSVVNYLAVSTDTGKALYLVMDYMKGGSLFDCLEDHTKEMDQTEQLRLATETAEGLRFLHDKNIPHGNMTSFNVLLDEDDHAKIADYGFIKRNK